MKTDDDAFVRIDEVLSSLKGKTSGGLLYGHISFQSEPHRDKNNKWYISNEVSTFSVKYPIPVTDNIYRSLHCYIMVLFDRNGHILLIRLGPTVQVT